MGDDDHDAVDRNSNGNNTIKDNLSDTHTIDDTISVMTFAEDFGSAVEGGDGGGSLCPLC